MSYIKKKEEEEAEEEEEGEKKSLYSTYSSILVINVCNQGKTLCSPCSIWTNKARNCNFYNVILLNKCFRFCNHYVFITWLPSKYGCNWLQWKARSTKFHLRYNVYKHKPSTAMVFRLQQNRTLVSLTWIYFHPVVYM